MSAIDITTMRGEMPRAVPHLLPEQAATVAKNCHFRHGVITPIMADVDGVKTFSLKSTTIFRYRDDYWFAWPDIVDAIRSPVAQDKYERVYFTDGKYPKVTSNEIATQGNGNFPAVSFRLGIPAPSNAIEVTAITPPADHGDDDPTDDDTRFYVETYVTGYGEEGPPGPVSQEVTIVYPGSTVDLALQPPGNLAEIAAAGPEAIAAAIANLGLTDTAAIATNALLKNQNLNDVANKTTARTNLGLKGAAVLDVGSIANTVAAGNDTRIVNAVQSTNAAITLPGSLTTAGTVTGGGISSIGAVYAGNTAAWLAADGNVYGSVWGGYLSTYIANVIAQARVPDTYGIGSYAFAINSTNVGNAVNPGDVKAGSELKWNNVANYNNGQTLLTGTWRCQGFAAVNDGLTRNTLWMRIS
ncbi:hypothetical protein [Yersinia intermedia]|uniref:hypothetical protein n=1 Tax=Yersinia intermedia TaxID=631 RepID=UPI0005E7B451|nr:hypothetical protein [Yersinia intermedia]CNI87939.1 Tail fiber [Yersinia intermedia]